MRILFENSTISYFEAMANYPCEISYVDMKKILGKCDWQGMWKQVNQSLEMIEDIQDTIMKIARKLDSLPDEVFDAMGDDVDSTDLSDKRIKLYVAGYQSRSALNWVSQSWQELKLREIDSLTTAELGFIAEDLARDMRRYNDNVKIVQDLMLEVQKNMLTSCGQAAA